MEYKNLNIKYGGHDGFLFVYNGINIYIDPIKLNDFSEKADLILITHGHHDHLSVEDVKKIIKPGTNIIGPAEILSQTRQIKDGIDFEIAEPGKVIDFNGIQIVCVASYNTNKPFHPKDEGYVGYVIDIGDVKIYHSGDSDIIPEMNSLRVDIAMLPVSGKFTMDFHEAIMAAEIIKPDLAIPMHYGVIIGSVNDAERFVEGCKEKGINAVVLEKEI